MKLQNDIYTAVELKKKKKASNMIEFQLHDGNFRGSFQSELHSKQEYTAEMMFHNTLVMFVTKSATIMLLLMKSLFSP